MTFFNKNSLEKPIFLGMFEINFPFLETYFFFQSKHFKRRKIEKKCSLLIGGHAYR